MMRKFYIIVVVQKKRMMLIGMQGKVGKREKNLGIETFFRLLVT